MPNCLVGADPEFFLQDRSGKFISAVGLIGGTKQNPSPIPGLRKGFAVQEDNVAVEFNIPPSKQLKEFVNNIHKALEYIEDKIANLGLKAAIVASAEFSEDQLLHPKTREFGCESDFDVWNLVINSKPKCENKYLRSAGGHVHLACKEDPVELGRACDLFMGVPSIFYDPDKQRRLLYGKPGTIRTKPYGVEYRTLSNFWIKNPTRTAMIFEQAQQAVSFVERGHIVPKDDHEAIQSCINNTDIKTAKKLIKKFRIKC